MRASDLQGRVVRDETGRRLGRLDELHIRNGKIISLTYGPVGLLQRFGPARAGHRISWSRVVAVTDEAVVVARGTGSAARH